MLEHLHQVPELIISLVFEDMAWGHGKGHVPLEA